MPWVKTLHIFFVMAWMAGIFYLPRIFVHHAESLASGEQTSRLETMERKLFWFSTMNALLALIFGAWLWLGYGIKGGWLHPKLALVLLLIGYHFSCLHFLKAFKRGENRHSSKFFRFFNEGSMILILPIIYFAVAKPF